LASFYPNARSLFSAGYIKDSTFSKQDFLEAMGPAKGSYRNCGMQGQASTSSAETETTRAGGFATTAQANLVKLMTTRMLMLPLALGLKVRALQRRWGLVGQTTLQAEKGHAVQTA